MRTRNAKHRMNYIPSPLSHELKTVNPQYQIHIAAVRFGNDIVDPVISNVKVSVKK